MNACVISSFIFLPNSDRDSDTGHRYGRELTLLKLPGSKNEKRTRWQSLSTLQVSRLARLMILNHRRERLNKDWMGMTAPGKRFPIFSIRIATLDIVVRCYWKPMNKP